jgi:hypothetical protein
MDLPNEPTRGFQGVWINASLWNDEKLTWLEKALIAEIDSLSYSTNPCYASAEYLAGIMRSTPSSIRNMLSELTRAGYLLQLGSDGRRTWRCVAPKYCSNVGKYEAWSCHQGYNQAVIRDVTARLHQKLPRGDTEILDEILTEKPPIVPLKGDGGVTSENGSKPKKEKLTVELVLSRVRPDLTLQSPDFLEAWTSWVKNRLELPKPTIGAFEEHMRICGRLGQSRAIAAIHHSIASNWLSIFEARSSEKTVERRKVDKWEGL